MDRMERVAGQNGMERGMGERTGTAGMALASHYSAELRRQQEAQLQEMRRRQEERERAYYLAQYHPQAPSSHPPPPHSAPPPSHPSSHPQHQHSGQHQQVGQGQQEEGQGYFHLQYEDPYALPTYSPQGAGIKYEEASVPAGTPPLRLE